MEFQKIAMEIAVLFLIMLIGAYGGKAGFISEKTAEGINKVVVNITNPCLIIYGMQREFSRTLLENGIMLAAAGFATFGVLIAVSEIWGRSSKNKEKAVLGTEQFLFVFGNLGFLGIPILVVLFGDLGIFYVTMFGLAQNVLLFSYGYRLFGQHSGQRLWKTCMNNGMYSIIIALILFLANIRLPYPIYQPVNLIGNLTIPLVLLGVGSSLSRIPLRELFRSVPAWWISGVKLVVCPLVVLGFFLLVPMPHDVAVVTVIQLGMPAALLSSALAQLNGGDATLANKTVILSNLLVLLTMPCLIWFLAYTGIY